LNCVLICSNTDNLGKFQAQWSFSTIAGAPLFAENKPVHCNKAFSEMANQLQVPFIIIKNE
jgi:hypothetical protein